MTTDNNLDTENKLNKYDSYIMACEKGNLQAVILYLKELKENLSTKTYSDFQKAGFLIACRCGHIDCIDYFIFSPEINFKEDTSTICVGLCQCVLNKRSDIIEHVLNRTLELNYTDPKHLQYYNYCLACFKLFYCFCGQNNCDIEGLKFMVLFMEKNFAHTQIDYHILKDNDYDAFTHAWRHLNVAALEFLVEHFNLTGQEEPITEFLKTEDGYVYSEAEHILDLMKVNLERPLLENGIKKIKTDTDYHRRTQGLVQKENADSENKTHKTLKI